AMERTPRIAPYLLEIHYEFLQVLRTPSFSVPTLLFPAMFYLFFGVLVGGGAGSAMPTYLLATYGVFGVMGPALFGFGVGVAIDRESGLLRLKRVTPVPPLAYLGGKVGMSMAFGAAVVLELFLLGAILGGVRLERMQWLGLAGILVLGVLPFAVMGLALGTRLQGKAAPAVVNLIYLPMAFLSGLWIPVRFLPEILQQLAFVLPPYHLAQLALGLVGLDEGFDPVLHLGVLSAYTLVGALLAARGFRTMEH
ncbi:MAG: ABC transporter permease, partial [Holophagales bacterium]|nr:ABC transporter permease [Holophagales bacterium]